MNPRLRKWLPIALCCLPGVVAAAAVGLSFAIGGTAFGASLGGPLGFGLIALAMLACPLSMGLMMRRGARQNPVSNRRVTNCCVPGEQSLPVKTNSTARRRSATWPSGTPREAPPELPPRR